MTPAVAPAAKMRRTIAAVRIQGDRHLADAVSLQRRLDDHLGRELHARRPQIQRFEGRFPKGAKTAMEIRDRRTKEQPADGGEGGITDPAVLPRHRARQESCRRRLGSLQPNTKSSLARSRSMNGKTRTSRSCRRRRP
jgi:hypothetical protein